MRWPRTSTTRRSWRAVAEVAREARVLLVDRFEAMRELHARARRSLLSCSDNLHLNDRGHRCMAEQLARAIVGGLMQADAEARPSPSSIPDALACRIAPALLCPGGAHLPSWKITPSVCAEPERSSADAVAHADAVDAPCARLRGSVSDQGRSRPSPSLQRHDLRSRLARAALLCSEDELAFTGEIVVGLRASRKAACSGKTCSP